MMRLAPICCLLLGLSAAAAQPVRVVTWNLGEFDGNDQKKVERALSLFADTADVIALQECPPPARKPVAAGNEWKGVYEYSNAILSRWPIVQSGTVAANPAWARDLPWADIQPPDGPPFRIYSVHLTFNRNGNPFLGDARAVEIRRILLHARAFSGPVILAGDFNTVGWILGGQTSEPAIDLLRSSGYADAFHSVGGRTQALLGRLDWIYTRGFAAADAVIGQYNGSDHRWLRASLSPSESPVPITPPIGDTAPVIVVAATVLALWGFLSWRKRRKGSQRQPRQRISIA